MRSIHLPIILSIMLMSCGTTRLENPQTCDAKLQKVMSLTTDAERVKELKVRVKRCPTHVPTLLATAKLYSEMTKEADENWLKLSVQYYQTAVDSAPNNVEAHSGLASVLEYVGEYKKAVAEYQWVIENATDTRQQADARVHKITCTFLDKNTKKKPASSMDKKDSINISPESIKEKSGWDYLKELTASIAIAGGITALKGNGQHVQYALGLLYDWIDAPQGQSVQARNRFLSGMVSTLTTIIAEKQLGTKLGSLYDPRKNGMPDGGYAGEMEKDFKSGQPDEGRTFDISDDLTVTEKWDVPDLRGAWICSSTNGRMIRGKGMVEPGGTSLAQIVQDRNTVEITVSAYSMQAKYFGEINGRYLEAKHVRSSYGIQTIGIIKLYLISNNELEGTARVESGDIIAESDIKYTRR
jgi:hypothetical protein